MTRATLPNPFDVTTAPFEPGLSLVEASAGTGKTFSISLSVVRLLLEGTEHAPLVSGVGRILVVTFTNAATDELINRIRKVLRHAVDVYSGAAVDESDGTVTRLRAMAQGKPWAEARMRAALAAVDTLSVFTIHGFAKRVLDEFALESGTPFGATLLENEDDLVREALYDWWRRTFYEHDGLARYAVEQSLSPESFFSDYRTWANWPGATLAPALTMADFERELLAAVQAFGAVWNTEQFAARAGAMRWNSGAVCDTPEKVAAIGDAVALAQQVRVGDPALLSTIVPAIVSLTETALAAKATKRSKADKAAVAELVHWPECAPAQRVADIATGQLAALRADCLREVQRVVAREKTRRQSIGFGDLLERLHGVLTTQGADGLLARTVRAQFDAALIDEFQDTDAFQFGIFSAIFDGKPLFLIGDPKQAIYGFRGADVQAYLRAASEAPASRHYTLQRNFRSSTNMVQAVNQLFARRKQPFLQPGIDYPPAVAARHEKPAGEFPDQHALVITWLEPGEGGESFSKRDAETVSFDACVREIVALLGHGWKPQHIAVLVRTGREGREMEALLRQANVPAVVSGMDDVFSSREMAELELLLRAIAAPRQATLVRAALATDLWGATHDDIAALLSPEGEGQWEALLNALATWRDRWAREGLMSMLHACFAERQVMERLLPLTDGDRRVTNLRHATELVHAAAAARQLNIDGVLRWLATERATAHTDSAATELRLETDADAVHIVTIHKSKGLEYDIVFCPTLWNARLTSAPPVVVQEDGQTVFEHGSAQAAARVAAANASRLAEDLRLLYVALTRARFRTYITWGPVVSGNAKERAKVLLANGSIHSALGYLLLVDDEIDGLAAQQGGVAAATRATAALLDSQPTWYRHLSALAKSSDGRIALRSVSGVMGGARYTPPPPLAPVLAARTVRDTPRVDERFRTYRLTSYTALASAGGSGSRPSGDDGDLADAAARDSDAIAARTEAAPVASSNAALLRALPRSDFRAFPAGAREGTVLHRLFEEAGFADTLPLLRARAARVLQWSQLADSDADERIDAVAGMMRTVFETPFTVPPHDAHGGGRPVVLQQVPPTHMRREWQFTLPVANATSPLSARALAEAFRTSASPALRRYADAVQGLPMKRVFGFLQGFVDLACEHEGRWYVVDWKSNRLPLDPESFAPEALMATMESHHYVLQAYLYLVALHRFLRTRLPQYRVEEQLSGAAYAFLRGFAPAASATGHGWLTLPAEPAVILALDAALGGHDVLAVRT
jgi:exodeoxyribonuclease V beta subunit